MLLTRLRCLSYIEARQLIHTNRLNNVNQFKINNGASILRSSNQNPNLTAMRHYYKNYDHHPSKIVRAYRHTRTWLTEHFVFGERRMENIYSASFLLAMIIFFFIIVYLNLELGNEGLDVNRTKTEIPK